MKKFLFLLALTFLFVCAEAQEFCGTPSLEEYIESGMPLGSPESRDLKFNTKKSDGLIYIQIPVLIYIWNTPEITIQDVNEQLEVLNQEFLDMTQHTYFRVEFCLATAENGHPNPLPTPNSPTITTVHQHSNRGLFWVEDIELSPEGTMPHMGLGSGISWSYFHSAIGEIDGNRYFRIYVGPVESSSSFSTMVPPYLVQPTLRFVAVNSDHFINNTATPTFNDGKVLVHETGHYFGLFHPFDGGCPTDPNTYNCSTDGDRICDTPQMTMPSQSVNTVDCTLYQSDQCPGFTDYPAQRDNHMDYVADPCRSTFTSQQCDIMQHTFSAPFDEHYQLHQHDNLMYTLPNCDPLNPDDGRTVVVEGGREVKKSALWKESKESNSFNVSLYPVPAVDELNLSIDSPIEEKLIIAVLEVSGKTLQEMDFTATPNEVDITLNTSQLQPGIYYVEVIRSNGGSSTHKFVKL